MQTFTETELDIIARGVLPPGWSSDLLLPALVQELRLARSTAGEPGRRVIDVAQKLMNCAAEFDPSTGACNEHFSALDDALASCPGTTSHHLAEHVARTDSWIKEREAASRPINLEDRPLITAAQHSLLMALKHFAWCLGVSHTGEDGGTLWVCITAANWSSELPETWYGWPVGVVIGTPEK